MTTSPWISVQKRNPDYNISVLLTDFKHATVGFMHRSTAWFDITNNCIRWTPTHWMPIPDPPKPEDPFTTWWECTGKWIGCGSSHDYARKIWDAAIASQKTDKHP